MADDMSAAEQPEQGLDLTDEDLDDLDNVGPDVELDDLDDEAPAGGQQPDEGLGDQSPETGQAERQDSTAAPPPEQPAPHPDNVDIAAMTDEEYVAWVQENPAAGHRMGLRQADYTKGKTEQARREEALQAREEELDRIAAAQQGPVREPQGTTPAGELTPEAAEVEAETTRLLHQLQRSLGREPTYAELAVFSAKHFAGEQVGDVAVVQAQQDAMLQQSQAAELRRQQEELVAKYPEATDPRLIEPMSRELSRLVREGEMVQPGDLEKAFHAATGSQRHETQTAAQRRAREQQAQQAEQQPALSPATAGEGAEAGLPETSDLDEIARRQKARMRAR